jgi:hypothetical protein
MPHEYGTVPGVDWPPPKPAAPPGSMIVTSGGGDEACPDCRQAYPSKQSNYDHVHDVDTLPRARRTDGLVIRRGYAVGMDGEIPQMWLFFDHIEPALVCGRAARMSIGDITGYGVYEAAQELRFDPRRRRDVSTLHVRTGDVFDRCPDEKEAFTRWVAGCDHTLSHWTPPPGMRRRPPTPRSW